MLIMDFSVENIIHFAFTTVNIKTEELGAKNMRINLNKMSKKARGMIERINSPWQNCYSLLVSVM